MSAAPPAARCRAAPCYGTLGVVVGANFAVTDGIIAGVEFQGDAYWNGGGFTAYDALALGRVGGFISDNTLLYGDLGAGFLDGDARLRVRRRARNGPHRPDERARRPAGHRPFWRGPSTAKATVGLLWHIN